MFGFRLSPISGRSEGSQPRSLETRRLEDDDGGQNPNSVLPVLSRGGRGMCTGHGTFGMGSTTAPKARPASRNP